MKYRKIKGDRIFTGQDWAAPEQVLVTQSDGTIEGLIPESEAGEEIEMHEGMICPGLINAHCHLELSHLKGLVEPGTGLVDFLIQVVSKRDKVEIDVQEAISKANQEMEKNGIVAVGDICNTTDSLLVKKGSGIFWTNFIEVLSFRDDKAAERVNHYRQVRDEFRTLPQQRYMDQETHRASLVPHAPYSISPRSFEMINDATGHEVISMHNQETPAENELYQTGSGEFMKLFAFFGNQNPPNPVTGKSSLSSVLPYFNQGQSLLLVHNTCTTSQDVQEASRRASENGIQLHYCLCPNANLYIENKLPPVAMLIEEGVSIVLGTDSLSSNYQLSIAEEIRTLMKGFPEIPLEVILRWATLNGARALRRDDTLGSFEPGKKPGVLSIDPDFNVVKLLSA